jgi:hypothetical protein
MTESYIDLILIKSLPQCFCVLLFDKWWVSEQDYAGVEEHGSRCASLKIFTQKTPESQTLCNTFHISRNSMPIYGIYNDSDRQLLKRGPTACVAM